jgi:hypothetical protein
MYEQLRGSAKGAADAGAGKRAPPWMQLGGELVQAEKICLLLAYTDADRHFGHRHNQAPPLL